MFSFVPSGLSEWQRSFLPDFFSSSWPVDNKLAAELCSRWQCQKDKLTCRYFVAVLFINVAILKSILKTIILSVQVAQTSSGDIQSSGIWGYTCQ